MDLPGRRDPEAAVAHHDRSDPVPRRYGEHAIPHHLGIVVGVDVDKPWSNHAARRVDLPFCAALHVTQGCDLAADNPDIPHAPRRTRAVNQCSTANQ